MRPATLSDIATVLLYGAIGLFLLILVLLIAACATTPPVPTHRTLAVLTCVPAAKVTLRGPLIDVNAHFTGQDGSTTWILPGAAFAFYLSIQAEGFEPYQWLVQFPPDRRQVLVGACTRLTDTVSQIQLPPLLPERPVTHGVR